MFWIVFPYWQMSETSCGNHKWECPSTRVGNQNMIYWKSFIQSFIKHSPLGFSLSGENTHCRIRLPVYISRVYYSWYPSWCKLCIVNLDLPVCTESFSLANRFRSLSHFILPNITGESGYLSGREATKRCSMVCEWLRCIDCQGERCNSSFAN